MVEKQDTGDVPLTSGTRQLSPPSSRSVRSRRRVLESDHPARDAEAQFERTLRAGQRIMAETGMDAQGVCDCYRRGTL